jgi:hypothetical protein
MFDDFITAGFELVVEAKELRNLNIDQILAKERELLQ